MTSRDKTAWFTDCFQPIPKGIAAITDDPAGGTLWSLYFNSEWAPAILTVLKLLARAEAWKGTQSDVNTALQSGHTILGQIQEFAGVAPIGTIIAHACATAPANTLACDGTHYLKADYPALVAALDSTFSVDSTHFRVPDLRSRSIVGVGQGSGLSNRALDASGGAETHALTTAELAQHTHPQRHNTNTTGDEPMSFDLGGTGASHLKGSNVTSTQGSNIVNTDPAGSGTAHENMHPWRALHYAIVYQ